MSNPTLQDSASNVPKRPQHDFFDDAEKDHIKKLARAWYELPSERRNRERKVFLNTELAKFRELFQDKFHPEDRALVKMKFRSTLDNSKRPLKTQDKRQEKEKEKEADHLSRLTIWSPSPAAQSTARDIFIEEVKPTVLEEISAMRISTKDNLKLYNMVLAGKWHSLTEGEKAEYERKAVERNKADVQKTIVDKEDLQNQLHTALSNTWDQAAQHLGDARIITFITYQDGKTAIIETGDRITHKEFAKAENFSRGNVGHNFHKAFLEWALAEMKGKQPVDNITAAGVKDLSGHGKKKDPTSHPRSPSPQSDISSVPPSPTTASVKDNSSDLSQKVISKKGKVAKDIAIPQKRKRVKASPIPARGSSPNKPIAQRRTARTKIVPAMIPRTLKEAGKYVEPEEDVSDDASSGEEEGDNNNNSSSDDDDDDGKDDDSDSEGNADTGDVSVASTDSDDEEEEIDEPPAKRLAVQAKRPATSQRGKAASRGGRGGVRGGRGGGVQGPGATGGKRGAKGGKRGARK